MYLYSADLTLRGLVGLATLIVSCVCSGMALAGWGFLRRSSKQLGKVLANQLLVDAVLLMLNAVIGIAIFLKAPSWWWSGVQMVRLLVLLVDLYAIKRLLRHFQRAQELNSGD